MMSERMRLTQRQRSDRQRNEAHLARPAADLAAADPARAGTAVAGSGPLTDAEAPVAQDPSLGHDFGQLQVQRSGETEGEADRLSDDYAPAPDAAGGAPPPGQDAPPGLIVDDDTEVETMAPGQMTKSAFLGQLRGSVDAALASGGPEVVDEASSQMDMYFMLYGFRSAQELENDIRQQTPEAAGAGTANDYIGILTSRVRDSVSAAASQADPPGGGGGQLDEKGRRLLDTVDLGLPGAPPPGAPPLPPLELPQLQGKGRAGRLVEATDPLAIQAQLGDGLPLEGRVRSQMEGAFGADLSGVRVHTDPGAAALAAELDSRAFAVGDHIAFGTGEYRPGTLVGDALIAHELAHVMQQSGGAAGSLASDAGHEESQALEEDADLSAVGAVASAWSGARGSLSRMARSAGPRFRSGLGLRRCPVAAVPKTVTFPGFAEVVGDATVSAAMTAAWGTTEGAANATGRREEAFWIMQNVDTKTFSVGPTILGPTVGPADGASVNPGARPADAKPVFSVAVFHTHTPTAFRTVGRPIGPSTADNNFMTANDVTGPVYDYTESPGGSGNIPAGHPIGSAAQVYQAGPDKRTKE